MADPTADAWEGDGLADQGQSFGELALGDERHIALDVDTSRAGGLAWRRPTFGDSENARHSVVGFVDSSLSILHCNRTDSDTLTAGSAPGYVHVARLLLHFNLEISLPPLHPPQLWGEKEGGRHLSLGKQADIGMPYRLQELGRQEMLWYPSPISEKRRFLHQTNFQARVGQVKSSLHASNATTDNQYRFCHSVSHYR
jgi:hypothetical protein